MLREQFAHPHEAQIGKIGRSIGIPVGKARELIKYPRVSKESAISPSFSIAKATDALRGDRPFPRRTASQMRSGSVTLAAICVDSSDATGEPHEGGRAPLSRAFSSCSRMRWLRRMPDRFDPRSSHTARSFVRRIVTV